MCNDIKNVRGSQASISVNPCTNWIKQFFPLSNLNRAVRNNKFPYSLKLPDTTLAYKRLHPSDKVNYRLVSVSPLLSKYLKKIFMTSCINIWKTSLVSYFVVSEKHILHNMLCSGYFRNGKHILTRWVMLVQFLWICLKHMTVITWFYCKIRVLWIRYW